MGQHAGVTYEPTPAVAGTSQNKTVSGLPSTGTTYYFAIKTMDEAGNWSSLSNVVSAATSTVSDTTAPAAVTSLAAGNPTPARSC